MDITTDHDKGQGYKEYEMTRPSIICDGCNVRAPFEHRCHGRNAYVRGERTGKACDCQECRDYVTGAADDRR
jgi:hypothetical protein